MNIIIRDGLDMELINTLGDGGGTYYIRKNITEVWTEVSDFNTNNLKYGDVIELFLPHPITDFHRLVHCKEILENIKIQSTIEVDYSIIGYWREESERIIIYKFIYNDDIDLSEMLGVLREDLKQEAVAIKVNGVPYFYV